MRTKHGLTRRHPGKTTEEMHQDDNVSESDDQVDESDSEGEFQQDDQDSEQDLKDKNFQVYI